MDDFHFTPTWTSRGTPPRLWNGTLTGKHDPETGVTIRLEIGSTTTTGTGPWVFTAPGFTVESGVWRGVHNGVSIYGGPVAVEPDGSLCPITNGRPVTSIEPCVWTPGSWIEIQAAPKL